METVSSPETEPLRHSAVASEAEHQVKKLITKYSHLFAQHQWPSEHLRWTELLFALTCKLTSRPEQEVRSAIDYLDGMDLLGVDDLATRSAAHTARVSAELQEIGFSAAEANDILEAVSGAARALKDQYGGKVQLFLRKHGEVMARELLGAISPSARNEGNTRDAIRYWLQNVLDMPIVLNHASLQAFCTKFGFTEAELTAEADRQELNVALLDDMIDQRVIDERKERTDDA